MMEEVNCNLMEQSLMMMMEHLEHYKLIGMAVMVQ